MNHAMGIDQQISLSCRPPQFQPDIRVRRSKMSTEDNTGKFRIDKWLCAARFFKTRSLAADAVECGKVHINETRVKPAKAVLAGDMLTINIGQKQYVVEVLALSDRRGPASEAQKLYRETDASRQRREAHCRANQGTAASISFSRGGRPSVTGARSSVSRKASDAFAADNPDPRLDTGVGSSCIAAGSFILTRPAAFPGASSAQSWH